jgi:hypothetical protein
MAELNRKIGSEVHSVIRAPVYFANSPLLRVGASSLATPQPMESGASNALTCETKRDTTRI